MLKMDYVDQINYNADKVAAANGNNPYVGAVSRYNQVAADVPGAVAAVCEKLGALQNVVVKLASVVENIAEGASELIAANQGNADTRIQGAEGVDESTNEDLKKMESTVSGDLDNSIMQDSKNEGDITSKKYADAGVGVAKNPKQTTGDIIAAAKRNNSRVANILRELQAKK